MNRRSFLQSVSAILASASIPAFAKAADIGAVAYVTFIDGMKFHKTWKKEIDAWIISFDVRNLNNHWEYSELAVSDSIENILEIRNRARSSIEKMIAKNEF